MGLEPRISVEKCRRRFPHDFETLEVCLEIGFVANWDGCSSFLPKSLTSFWHELLRIFGKCLCSHYFRFSTTHSCSRNHQCLSFVNFLPFPMFLSKLFPNKNWSEFFQRWTGVSELFPNLIFSRFWLAVLCFGSDYCLFFVFLPFLIRYTRIVSD